MQIKTYLELRDITFCMVNISITGILSFLYSHPQIIKNQRSPEEIVEINKTVKKVRRSMIFFLFNCMYKTEPNNRISLTYIISHLKALSIPTISRYLKQLQIHQS